MAILMEQTLVGNIGSIYDLRTVGKDKREVIDFTIAVTPREKDADGEWSDGETYWMTVTAWGKLAVNIEASFNKGDRVFVKGRTYMKKAYENKEGVEVPAKAALNADFAGLEVSNHSAKSDRVAGGGSNASAKKAPAKKAAPKKVADDDLDFESDDDVDF